MKKPHVLFLDLKWYDGNPEHGVVEDETGWYGALKMSDLAIQEKFFLDEYWFQNGILPGPAVVKRCIDIKPDLLIISLPHRPEIRYLYYIKEELKIPMIYLCGDSAHPIIRGWVEDILPFLEFCAVLDTKDAFSQTTDHPEKFFPHWGPRNGNIFCDPGLPRDIGISFPGNVGGFRDRISGLEALKEKGIDVYQAGGYREHKLSIEEYASIYKRSKIAVNFCCNILGIAQCKGRVFEATMCGAMLLEAENAETAVWFEPMVDYVPFKDNADLVKKARYYLGHDSERTEIAARGHKKAIEKYTGTQFWEVILGKVFGERGLNEPEDSR